MGKRFFRCKSAQDDSQPYKMVKHFNILPAFLPINCLSRFDHFMGFALEWFRENLNQNNFNLEIFNPSMTRLYLAVWESPADLFFEILNRKRLDKEKLEFFQKLCIFQQSVMSDFTGSTIKLSGFVKCFS